MRNLFFGALVVALVALGGYFFLPIVSPIFQAMGSIAASLLLATMPATAETAETAMFLWQLHAAAWMPTVLLAVGVVGACAMLTPFLPAFAVAVLWDKTRG